MTTELAERRKGQALALFVAAAGLIGIAAVTVAIETRASRPDLASGLVVPGLHDTIGTGRRITITSSDASYRIERAQRGNESIWVMRDRGDYPVAQTIDVEAVLACSNVDRLLVGGQQVQEQRGEPGFVEGAGDLCVARAQATGAAAVREQHDPAGCVGNGQRSLEPERKNLDVERARNVDHCCHP